MPPADDESADSGSGSFRPAFSLSARDAGDIAGRPEVLITNAVLALLLLLLVLFDATIINSTVKENHEFFEPWIAKVAGPIEAVYQRTGALVQAATGNWDPSRLAKYGGLLTLTSVIYAALDADFGFNQTTFVLLLSLIVGIGIMTVTFDGAQVWVARRRFGVPAGIMFFPFAIVLAVVSVIISRLFDVHPGIIYGFVAAAVLTSKEGVTPRVEGHMVFIPMLVLLGISLLSWLALSPIRVWAEDGSFLGAVFEAVAVAMFVGGIQGVLFNLIPIEFMDGQKVWQWSKAAWFAIAAPVTFIFVHVLMNPNGDFDTPIEETGLGALLVLCSVIWVLTASVWYYFRRRNGRVANA